MMAGEFPVQPSADMLALAWLQLSMADPRTLSPQQLQLRNEMHQALNQRMQRDPYGVIPLAPTGPSYLQQRYRFQQQHGLQPFQERFPLPSWESPFTGKDSRTKTGVSFRPSGTEWGI